MQENVQQRRALVDEYAAASRAYCAAVEQLRQVDSNVEDFIRSLDAVGTAHRACEQMRIRLDKHLARIMEPW